MLRSKMLKTIFFNIILQLVAIEWKCKASPIKCMEKVKSWVLLESANDLISKAKNLISESNTSDFENVVGSKEEHPDKKILPSDSLGVQPKRQYDSVSGGFEDVVVPEAEKPDIKALPSDFLEVPQNGQHESGSGDLENITRLEEENPDLWQLPSDCIEIQQRGQNKSGIYTIRLFNKTASINKIVNVYCDMDTDGGGWIVIQRRDEYIIQENFDRGWIDYKNGFGNLSQEFWIGNDIIHALTYTGSDTVRFDMEDAMGNTIYALYKWFTVANETNFYELNIGHYSGNAGNSYEANIYKLTFSTKDKEGGCPNARTGGWWWTYFCSGSNPNGLYRPGETNYQTMSWDPWKKDEGLSSFEIKTRKDFYPEMELL